MLLVVREADMAKGPFSVSRRSPWSAALRSQDPAVPGGSTLSSGGDGLPGATAAPLSASRVPRDDSHQALAITGAPDAGFTVRETTVHVPCSGVKRKLGSLMGSYASCICRRA